MTDLSIEPISKDLLTLQWYRLLQQVLNKLQLAYRTCGYTQDAIATRIGKDPATVNRCLRGQQANMTLRTMHDLARGMGFRLRIELDRLDDQPKANRRPRKNDVGEIQKQPQVKDIERPPVYRMVGA
jgi:transcriptional regulator with XRE-family HTH domain